MSLAGLQSSWSPAINSYGGGSAPTNSISGGTAPNVGSVTVQSGSGSVNVISETGSVVIQTSLNGEVLIAPNADTPTAVVGPVHYTAGPYNAADAYGTGAIVQFTDSNFYLAEGPVPVGDPGPTAGGSQFILFSGTGGGTPAAISEGTAPTASSVTCAGGNITTAATGTLTATSVGTVSMSSSASSVAISGQTALAVGAITGNVSVSAPAGQLNLTSGTTMSLNTGGVTVINNSAGRIQIESTGAAVVGPPAVAAGYVQIVGGPSSATQAAVTVTTQYSPTVGQGGFVVTPSAIYFNGVAITVP